MSFTGPADAMLQEMLVKASARGIVLIAAVGNSDPRSPPLYPAADPGVIGVTATDAQDRLMPEAIAGRKSLSQRRALKFSPPRRMADIRLRPVLRLPLPMRAAWRPCCWRRSRNAHRPRWVAT